MNSVLSIINCIVKHIPLNLQKNNTEKLKLIILNFKRSYETSLKKKKRITTASG